MASESTELTFVRCRSCGALVPATASRCRICNAALENGAKSDDAADGDKHSPGRVRQKTMSHSSSDVGSAISQVRDDVRTPDPMRDSGHDSNGVHEEDLSSSEDPLGAFMEEVDEPITRGTVHPFEPPPAAVEPPKAKPVFFSEEREIPPYVEPEPEIDEFHDELPTPPRDAGSGKREVGGYSDISEDEDFGPPKDLESSRETRGYSEERPRSKPATSTREERVVRDDKATPGRLVGWLVSYLEPDGAATELREGKCFISNSPLKGNDLVLDDPSVSTPHALMLVGGEKKVIIQDLMSDRGVFLRSNGDATYRREEGQIALKNGDWVRFGDVEFLVCLVAHVGAK